MATENPIKIDLSPYGLPPMTVAELTEAAVRAKTRIKQRPAIGWSMPSKMEIIAMVFVLDQYFTDSDLPAPRKGKGAPTVYSHI